MDSDSAVKVSVIMSTYNRAHYLPDALNALDAQDCELPYEVIVIDNASTDSTPSVLQKWCEKNSRFRSARENRLGLSWGKNAGIQMARARLLLFTDDDMLVDPSWVRSYWDFFARHKDRLMLVGGPYIPIPHDLGQWPAWFSEPALADVALLQYQKERILDKKEWVWGGNMAVPAKLFEQFGLWNVAVGRRGDERGTFEDTEFQDRIRNAGGAVWFCPSAIVHHRVDRQTITPSRVLGRAFARGRNEFWQEGLRNSGEPHLVPTQNLVACLTGLAVGLCLWVFWTVFFRILSSRTIFARAHRAARSCGWWLGRMEAGRTSTTISALIAHATFVVRARVLYLMARAS